VKRFTLLLVMCISVSGCGEFNAAKHAEGICRRHILNSMLDRSDARFQNPLSYETGTNRYRVTWTVIGRNGFGGMVSQNRSCTVAFDGEPTWAHAPHRVY